MTDLIEVASDILPGTWREGADPTCDQQIRGVQVPPLGTLNDVQITYLLTLDGREWSGEMHVGTLLLTAIEVRIEEGHEPADPECLRNVAINLRDRSHEALGSMIDGLEEAHSSLERDP